MANRKALLLLIKKVKAMLEVRQEDWRLDSQIIRKRCTLVDFIALEECLKQDKTANFDEFKKKFLGYYQHQFPLNPYYFEIARVLFDKETLGVLLRHTLPPSTKLIGLDFLVNDKKLFINVVEQDFETIQEPAASAVLEHFVFINGLLFDVRDISSFNFRLHQMFYSQIKERYPNLSQAIYSHNQALKTLKSHLDQDTIHLAPPLSVINELVRRLRAGGSSVTHQSYASLDAQVAFTEFKAYLFSLPKDLRAIFESRFGAVIAHLNDSNCVEIAAGMIERRFYEAFRGKNDPLLVTAPAISTEECRALYGPLNSLETRSTRKDEIVAITRVSELPANVIAPLLNLREMQLAFLTAAKFDPEMVAVLLDLASVLDKKSLSQILQVIERNGYNALHLAAQYQPNAVPTILAVIARLPEATRVELLQSEQRQGDTALMLASKFHPSLVADFLKAMSDFPRGIQFALLEGITTEQVNQHRSFLITEAIARLDDEIPIESRIKALLNSMDFPDKIKSQLTILEIYEELKEAGIAEERKSSIRLRLIKLLQETMLKAAQFNPLLIPKLFDLSSLLNEDEQMSLLQIAQKTGHNALLLAAQYQPRAVPLILAAIANLPEVNRAPLLQARQANGYNALFLAALHQPSAVPDIFAAIANFPEADRVAFMQATEPNGYSALLLATQYQHSVVPTILAATAGLSKANRVQILQATQSNGYNALFLAAQYQPDAVPAILAAISDLSEADRVQFLQAKQVNGYNALLLAVRYQPSALPPVLAAIAGFPEANRVQFMQATQANGYSALLMAIQYQPSVVPTILNAAEDLPEANRVQILQATQANGHNALLLAIQYQPSVVPNILAAMSDFSLSVQFALLEEVDIEQVNQHRSLLITNAIARLDDEIPLESKIKAMLNSIDFPDKIKSQFAILEIYEELKKAGTGEGVKSPLRARFVKVLQEIMLKGAQYQHSAVSAILAATADLPEANRVQFFQARQKDGYNALHLAAQCQPNAVPAILASIARLPEATRVELLQSTQRQGYTALMLASQFQPSVVADFLQDMSDFSLGVQFALLERVNTEQVNQHWSILITNAIARLDDEIPLESKIKALLSSMDFPNKIKSQFVILDVFEKLKKAGSAEGDESALRAQFVKLLQEMMIKGALSEPLLILKLLDLSSLLNEDEQIGLLQVTQETGYNPLLLASQYQPSAVPALLAAIAGLPETNRVQLLQANQRNGYNALHLAAQYQHGAVPAILKAIEGFPKADRVQLLQARQSDGYNCLHLAAQYHPTKVADFLAAMSDFSLGVQFALLEEVSTEQVNQHRSLLITNAIARLDDAIPIESKINALLNSMDFPDKIKSQFAILEIYEELKKAGNEEEAKSSLRARFIKVLQETMLKAAQFEPLLIPKLLDLSSLLNEDGRVGLLQATEGTGYNALCIAAQYQPSAVPVILAVIAYLPEANRAPLLQARLRNGYNALSLAARYQPSAVPDMLAAIANFPEAGRVAFMLETQENGYNALLLAARYQPSAVPPILDAIADFSEANRVQLLQATQESGENALLLAAGYQPSIVPAILAAISDFPEANRVQILQATQKNNYNALHLAIQYQPNAIPSLLAAIADIPEANRARLFQAIQVDGYNALHVAVQLQPNVLPPLLAAVAGLHEANRAQLLQATLRNGCNALHLAVQHQPNVLPPLLAAIAGLPEANRVQVFQAIERNGCNALHLAVQHQSSAVPTLLAAMVDFSLPERIKLVQAIQLRGFNVLQLTVKNQPALVVELLNAISDFPLIVQFSLLGDMNTRQKNQYKLLMLSNVIARLSDEISIERRLKEWLNTRLSPAKNETKIAIIHAYEEIKNSGRNIRPAIEEALGNPKSPLSRAFNHEERYRFFSSIQVRVQLNRIQTFLIKPDLDKDEKRKDRSRTIGV